MMADSILKISFFDFFKTSLHGFLNCSPIILQNMYLKLDRDIELHFGIGILFSKFFNFVSLQ